MSTDLAQPETESQFVARVAEFRREYHDARNAVLTEERERRHASGEVYFGGCWVPRGEVGKIIRAYQRHELVSFFEVVILLALGLGIAVGLCWLFGTLLLP
jgi:hypothetical protein